MLEVKEVQSIAGWLNTIIVIALPFAVSVEKNINIPCVDNNCAMMVKMHFTNLQT